MAFNGRLRMTDAITLLSQIFKAKKKKIINKNIFLKIFEENFRIFEKLEYM